MSDFELDLSWSLKVKSYNISRLPIVICSYCFIARYTRFQNLSDLDFDFPVPLKVKSSDTLDFPTYDFLLTFNSNIYRIAQLPQV